MTPKKEHLTALSRLLCGCAIAAGGGLLAAGCGGDDDNKDSAEKPATETSAATEKQGEAKTGKSKKSPEAKIDPETLKPDSDSAAKDVPKKGIPASASPFVGLSARRLSAGDVPAAARKAGGAGSWKVVLGESAYSLLGPKGPVSSGSLKVKAGKMTFSPLPNPTTRRGKKAKARRKSSNPELCAGKRGTYRYSVKGREITFTKVSEQCAARTVLDGGPWRNLSRPER